MPNGNFQSLVAKLSQIYYGGLLIQIPHNRRELTDCAWCIMDKANPSTVYYKLSEQDPELSYILRHQFTVYSGPATVIINNTEMSVVTYTLTDRGKDMFKLLKEVKEWD